MLPLSEGPANEVWEASKSDGLPFTPPPSTAASFVSVMKFPLSIFLPLSLFLSLQYQRDLLMFKAMRQHES